MSLQPITENEKKVLDFITASCVAGRAPTHREIADHFGFASANAANDYVTRLKKKGAIRTDPCARGIHVVAMDDPRLTAVILRFLNGTEDEKDLIHHMVTA